MVRHWGELNRVLMTFRVFSAISCASSSLSHHHQRYAIFVTCRNDKLGCIALYNNKDAPQRSNALSNRSAMLILPSKYGVMDVLSVLGLDAGALSLVLGYWSLVGPK
ncbi:hypothetical protein EJ05DRAFT_496296 [Pseudovirgaria hyperparasitica]|uniref:Uncharacterized protein n=1 Tax=Pseudovirgaria hyperparasitica TaxID=470096 RepID=A0A6A6WMP3_9PEZI|nr:uncharacterized protein EJ05DRAFT_496296 [Pseudovirgaria hyperparasitica]KAF2763475.1 hypothetical protein EJ05DRAFT_496296 [Pseudovirgaria hyperparasitica]